MKVYTITCHDVYNHGASLQAYALMKYVLNCGHDVEIIDYKPTYLSNHYHLFSINNPKWEKNSLMKFAYLTLKLPSRIKGLQRKKAFDTFTSTYLIQTKKRYTTNQELKEKLPIADIYICGSDQIWNSLYENGKDPAFYLDFAPENKVKTSYAASFATERIPIETTSFVQNKISYLNKVSVREKSGVNILRDIGIRNAMNVVDPTLLLNREEWNQIGSKRFKDNYILIYDFDHNAVIRKLAMEIAKKKNLKIFSVNPNDIKYADRQLKYVGPETFLSLVRDAKFVISNSFHAAVFSVIYNKDFAIVNRFESINTRMKDFLDDLGLNKRLINEHYILDDLLIPIDYKKTELVLKEKIAHSKQFLHDVLHVENKMRDIL